MPKAQPYKENNNKFDILCNLLKQRLKQKRMSKGFLVSALREQDYYIKHYKVNYLNWAHKTVL